MNIDFHTHGKLAKKLPFSSEYTRILFTEAKRAGLDALCLTEHFNTLGFHEIYEYIKNNYEREQDAFLVEGVKVFPGMEVDVREGGHILVLGDVETILTLNKELEDYKNKHNFLSFADLIEKKKTYDIKLGAAHAFRMESNIPYFNQELLKQLDFCDMNGKDYGIKGDAAKIEIEAFAKEIGIPLVAGSDTHQSFQYGCVWNSFDKDCNKIEELFEEMKKGTYEIKISEYIDFKVRTAGVLKKALKEIHACGGNYVRVMR